MLPPQTTRFDVVFKFSTAAVSAEIALRIASRRRKVGCFSSTRHSRHNRRGMIWKTHVRRHSIAAVVHTDVARSAQSWARHKKNLLKRLDITVRCRNVAFGLRVWHAVAQQFWIVDPTDGCEQSRRHCRHRQRRCGKCVLCHTFLFGAIPPATADCLAWFLFQKLFAKNVPTCRWGCGGRCHRTSRGVARATENWAVDCQECAIP